MNNDLDWQSDSDDGDDQEPEPFEEYPCSCPFCKGGAIVSAREKRLIWAMRDLGYACNPFGQSFTLTQLPIQPWVGCTTPLPYMFRSVQAAADWLCPIVRDEGFTALVAA